MRALVAIVCLLAAATASAHPLAPGLLAVDEDAASGRVVVRFRAPRAAPDARWLAPEGCRAASGAPAGATALACEGGIAGRTLGVAGLAAGGAEVVARVRTADGRRALAWLRAGDDRFTVPERPTRGSLFAAHARLGAAHLAGGLDHLLFVAGLVALLGLGRRLALAVTAFTLGHAATLAIVALGVARPPAFLVEPAIAATLLWLAWEIARAIDARGGPAALARRPLALPFAFGLLHGLGFASALDWLGVARADLALALAGFHAGIEAAQLAWIALAGAAGVALMRSAPRVAASRALRLVPVYAIGALGAYWLLARVAAIPAAL